MKKILVTGGAGFVGSALCKKLLDLGNEVFSLDNYFTGSKDNHHEGVKYFVGHTRDVNKIFTNINFDLIYHLGEYSRVEKSFEDPTSLIWDLNIAGTFSILEFWRKQNLKKNCKLLYAGSSTKFAEGEIGSTMSPYAWSKASNTELVKNYAKWFDLKYVITYFYNVYGEGEISDGPYSTIIGIFKKQFLQNYPLTVVKPGDQKRNFTHIDDIVDALVLVGEKGEGDEFGIGSEESFSVSEVAKMFTEDIIWMPERKGNRKGASVLSERTKTLGWSSKHSLANHIQEFKKQNSRKEGKLKNKILVFSTTFFPEEGYSEKTLFDLIKLQPDIHFDVITTNIGVNESLVYPENMHVYRIGNNLMKDKFLLARKGYEIAIKLAKENNYAFIWSIMASYGTLPAYLIKRKLKLPMLITLGDQKIPKIMSIKYWLFKFLISGGDQISTNSVLESNISRTSNLNWLKTLNKKGDTFSNAFRFAYNIIFAEIYKSENNKM